MVKHRMIARSMRIGSQSYFVVRIGVYVVYNGIKDGDDVCMNGLLRAIDLDW